MTEHTITAWTVSEAYGVIEVWQGGVPIAVMSGPSYEKELVNAHLAAAAPDLLEVALVIVSDGHISIPIAIQDKARAAIAKARGTERMES